MAEQPKIDVREINQEDYPYLIQLGRQALGASWSVDYLRWKYDANPAGSVYGAFASVDGKPAGFYSNIPVCIQIAGDKFLGAQAVDAAVAPEARRLGLFVRLAEHGYQRMDQDSLALDYAFPNPISEAGFVNRLAWQRVGLVPRYVKILDLNKLGTDAQRQGFKRLYYQILLASHYLGKGLSPKKSNSEIKQPLPDRCVTVTSTDHIDGRFDDLWKRCSGNFKIAVVRDQEYLKWRYIDNPLKQYRILIAERGELLAGCIVLSLRDYEQGRIAAIAELLVPPGDKTAGLALIASTITLARELGCAQLQAWMLPQHTFYTNLLESNGFIYLPKRWAPGLMKLTTPFIIRTRPGWQPLLDLCNLQNWFISMGDHDYY